MEERKRPIILAFIAWIIFFQSGYSLIIKPLIIYQFPVVQEALESSGMSVSVSLIWGILVGVVGIFSGIGILKGCNWARFLYLGFGATSLTLGWILYGFHSQYIRKILFYIFILIILTITSAASFFAKVKSEESISEK